MIKCPFDVLGITWLNSSALRLLLSFFQSPVGAALGICVCYSVLSPWQPFVPTPESLLLCLSTWLETPLELMGPS